MTAPKPSTARRLAGNPGHRPIPEPLAVIDGGRPAPPPPGHLGDAGRARWVEVWSVAGEWLDPALDASILTRYAELHDERAAFRLIVQREGRMSEGSLGQPKLHPAVSEVAAIDERLRAIEAELGLTPRSRRRLGIEHHRQPERPLTVLEQLAARRTSRESHFRPDRDHPSS